MTSVNCTENIHGCFTLVKGPREAKDVLLFLNVGMCPVVVRGLKSIILTDLTPTFHLGKSEAL